ncbi:hypothetical protein EVAR_12756_1 [Eumeta japonica]|uniref:Uncharacterized protein n=1 Tax=Eumeta variegata TaxID=151549 RepID=A0A4C1UBI3_EUMVA|nr:hypothetical protein EVAR_12756_1 [Eumeta japonica]
MLKLFCLLLEQVAPGKARRLIGWSTSVVEGIKVANFSVTMCNFAIYMRAAAPPEAGGGARRSGNPAFVAPSTTVRTTDAFPASLQKVSNYHSARGTLLDFVESLVRRHFYVRGSACIDIEWIPSSFISSALSTKIPTLLFSISGPVLLSVPIPVPSLVFNSSPNLARDSNFVPFNC